MVGVMAVKALVVPAEHMAGVPLDTQATAVPASIIAVAVEAAVAVLMAAVVLREGGLEF
jgi:hypothetical protein